MTPVIGAIVQDRYRLDRLLGQGGMGAVYAAFDQGEQRPVALKLIAGDRAPGEVLVSRFHTEGKVMAAIDSPHIARILATGTDAHSGHHFLVMELLDGEDAGQLFHRLHLLTPALALRIATQACRGLEVAHRAGVVHRDIKPANLFLARGKGTSRLVKVLDFGVAKIRVDRVSRAEPTDLTRTGAVLGSPLYMAPEQARGQKSIDHRADLWSLGIVLYQALAAHAPNQEIEALGELILAICTQAPTPLRKAAPWVPPEVAAIVDRALRLDPRDRFQSATEMRLAMEPLLPDGDAIEEALLVPLAKEDRARNRADQEISAITLAQEPRPPRLGQPRILLVEDDALNLKMLARRLERRGFTVLKAADGRASLAVGLIEKPDLILMDVSLPGIDGWEATRKLRAAPATKAIPIIALTAHAMTGDREKSLAAGCDEYEPKPVEFERLVQKIEALLARASRAG